MLPLSFYALLIMRNDFWFNLQEHCLIHSKQKTKLINFILPFIQHI